MSHPVHSTAQSQTQKSPRWQQENDDFFNSNFTSYNFTLLDRLTCVLEETPENFLNTSLFLTLVLIMYIAIFLLSLTGNGLVCFVVHTSPRMKTATNYFMVNLALGDILVTLFCVPFSSVPVLVLRYWPFGAVMCRVVNYLQAVSVLVSAYTLLAISIDRYLAILRPLKPRIGKTAAKLVVAAIWVGALVAASPIVIVSQLQKPSLWHQACNLEICSEKWSNKKHSGWYTIALLTLQFALPLTALIGTYGRIAYVVWGVRPPGEAQTDRDSRMQSSKRKVVKMMVTIVAVFVVCWLPLNIFILLWTMYGINDEWSSWQMPYVWFACHWLAMSHTCYNPIIYFYMNSKYRRELKQALSNAKCIKMDTSKRSRHRSSLEDGVPMSELVGVNDLQGRRCVAGPKTVNRKRPTMMSVAPEVCVNGLLEATFTLLHERSL